MGVGARSTPSVFSRGGTLLPYVYADARYIDAVIVSKAHLACLMCNTRSTRHISASASASASASNEANLDGSGVAARARVGSSVRGKRAAANETSPKKKSPTKRKATATSKRGGKPPVQPWKRARAKPTAGDRAKNSSKGIAEARRTGNGSGGRSEWGGIEKEGSGSCVICPVALDLGAEWCDTCEGGVCPRCISEGLHGAICKAGVETLRQPCHNCFKQKYEYYCPRCTYKPYLCKSNTPTKRYVKCDRI